MNWRAIIITILVLTVFISISAVTITSRADAPQTINEVRPQEFDVIILPGQGTYNGTLVFPNPQPGRDIVERLDAVQELFLRQEKKPLLIVSGYGRGYAEREPRDLEAEVMYQYLAPEVQKQGYEPAKYILKELRSHHTLENALYAKALLSENASRILVLAPTKSYQRTSLIFNSVFEEEEVLVVSLTPQTEAQLGNEKWRTLGTLLILSLPGDGLKGIVGKWVYPLVN